MSKTTYRIDKKRWWLGIFTWLIFSIFLFHFFSFIAIHGASIFDSMSLSYPRLFFLSFQQQSNVLFASLSIYIATSFFFKAIGKTAPKRRFFNRKSRNDRLITEFQGRSWSVAHSLCKLLFVLFLIFGSPGAHLVLVDQPVLKYFIYGLTAFLVWDVFWTISRVFKINWPYTAMLLVILPAFTFLLSKSSQGRWDAATQLMKEKRALFLKPIEVPQSKNAKQGLIERKRNHYWLVMDSLGSFDIYYDYRKISMAEILDRHEDSYRREKTYIAVIASKKTNLRKVYDLEKDLLFLPAKTFLFIVDSPSSTAHWWTNAQDRYASVRSRGEYIMNFLIPTKHTPPSPLSSPKLIRHNISPTEIKVNGRLIEDSMAIAHFQNILISDSITSLFFDENCTYGRYIQITDYLRSAIHIQREKGAEDLYGRSFDSLTFERKGVIKEEVPYLLFDESQFIYLEAILKDNLHL